MKKFDYKNLWLRSALHDEPIDFNDIECRKDCVKLYKSIRNTINHCVHKMNRDARHPMAYLYDEFSSKMLCEKMSEICNDKGWRRFEDVLIPENRSGMICAILDGKEYQILYSFSRTGENLRYYRYVYFEDHRYVGFKDVSLHNTDEEKVRTYTASGFDRKRLGRFLFNALAVEKLASDMCVDLMLEGKAKFYKVEAPIEEDIEIRDRKWLKTVFEGKIPQEGFSQRRQYGDQPCESVTFEMV